MWSSISAGFGPLGSLSSAIAEAEQRGRISFADFTQTDTLFVASDYSGEHREAAYYAYSFLIANPYGLRVWDERRNTLRKSTPLRKRRMSYKKMGDQCRGKSLWRFLQASEMVQGTLFAFLVDKRLGTLFSDDDDDGCAILLTSFKPATQEKVARVSHLLGLVLAGLLQPSQNLFWFTDHDAIASNEAQIRELMEATMCVLGNLVPHGFGHFRCGTTKHTDPGDLWVEDLTAIPDLAGGALVDLFTQYRGINSLPTECRGLTSPFPDKINARTRILLHWLAVKTGYLSKVFVVFEPNGEHGLRHSIVHLDGFA